MIQMLSRVLCFATSGNRRKKGWGGRGRGGGHCFCFQSGQWKGSHSHRGYKQTRKQRAKSTGRSNYGKRHANPSKSQDRAQSSRTNCCQYQGPLYTFESSKEAITKPSTLLQSPWKDRTSVERKAEEPLVPHVMFTQTWLGVGPNMSDLEASIAQLPL